MNKDTSSKNTVSNGVNEPTRPKKGNVLLIDDDKFLVDMYAMKFTQSGFNVQATLSAAEGLKVLRDGFLPDAILFDLIMPESDGFSFLESLRKDSVAPKAVKIALTNEMNDSEQARVLELGASRYIVKATMLPSEVVNIVAEEIAKQKHS